MTQAVYDVQIAAVHQNISNTVTQISSATTPEQLESALDILTELTSNPYLNNNATITTVIDALNQTLQAMNNLLNSSTDLSTTIEQAAGVLSNALSYVLQSDCGISTNFSSQALNSSYAILDELSDLSVKNSNQTGNPQIIDTGAFLLYSILLNSSQLSNQVINASNSTPVVTLGTVNNTTSLPDLVSLSYIYMKQDPQACNKTASSNPSTAVTLQIKDGETFQPITVSVSVTVTYPASVFKNLDCEEECTESKDSSGNPSCECSDISYFDIKNQLAKIYKSSMLSQITADNLKRLFTNPPYTKWSFWVAICYSVGLVLFLIFGNRKYCIVQKIMAEKKAAPDKRYTRIYQLFVAIVVTHPFTNFFVYATPNISKRYRALLYYLRVMILLGFSAAFAPNDSEVNNFFKIYHK